MKGLDTIFKASVLLGIGLLLLSRWAPQPWTAALAFFVLCIGFMAFAAETATGEIRYRRGSRNPRMASLVVAASAVLFMLVLAVIFAAMSIGVLIAEW